MKLTRSLSSLPIAVVLALSCRAALAEPRPLITSEDRIPLGGKKSYDLGTIAQATGSTLLRIDSRMDAKGLGGSMFFMGLHINGQPVLPVKSRTAVRMVNRASRTPVSSGVMGEWFYSTKPDLGWRVIYAPDFQGALRQTFYEGSPYSLVLDVSDLMRQGGANTLEIANTAPETVRKNTGTQAELVIGKLELDSTSRPSPMREAVVPARPIINRGEPGARVAAYRGEILPGGGFMVSAGQNSYRFSSAFSYPNAGFNVLSAGNLTSNAAQDWQVAVDKGTGKVTARGKNYRIERHIQFKANRVEVADTVTNLDSANPLGLAVRHELDLSAYPSPTVRLAGNPDPVVNNYYAPGNPSVHLQLEKAGVGFIAEDDVLRNQALLYVHPARGEAPPVAGLQTDMLRLAPGETYQLRWAVYPMAEPDYYDFINAVRRDWGANYTTPGSWWWGFLPDDVLRMSVEELRALIKNNGIRFANTDGGWLDRANPQSRIGFGVGVMGDYWKSYRSRIRQAAEKLRQADPAIKVLGYYDVQQDSSDDSPTRFPDSWLTNVHGKQIVGTWNYNGTVSNFYNTVPTLDNSFGKAAFAVAEKYMDEMKLDGLYWDEMDNITYGIPRISYNVFDGHSCQLDPKTWTMIREIGIAPLASKSFRAKVIDRITSRGGVILGNTPFGTLSELHTGIYRMVEIPVHDYVHYQGQLQTPLGYVGTRNEWDKYVRALNFGMLPVPILPDNRPQRVEGIPRKYVDLKHDITPYLFPFTPIELHEGYLLGQERIVATHNGSYGWAQSHDLAQSRHFDNQGKLTSTRFSTHCTASDARSAVKLSEMEAAVLVRIPVRLAPARPNPNWKATATVEQYDAKGLTLAVNAPQGATLTLAHGPFGIKGKKQFTVVSRPIGKALASRTLNATGETLRIAIPAGFNGTYTVFTK